MPITPADAALLASASHLVAATDGSSNAGRDGYAYILDTPGHDLYDFGPCHGEHPELTAILRLLDLVPDQVPLTIQTDCYEAVLRVGGTAPKRKNFYSEQIEQVMQRVAARPVDLVYVQQAQQRVPLHAAAHYLSYLGRAGITSTAHEVDANIQAVLAADDADQYAHDLVYSLIFPAAGTR